jgi:ubiquinone/menaquinone biosynthesis C-methylase UbiE
MPSGLRRLTGLVRPEPPLCSAIDPACQPRLTALNDALAAFYNEPQRDVYFAVGDALNEEWPSSFKAHHHLREAIPAGSHVLDLGCGAALASWHLRDRIGRYTGVDWSEDRIAQNRTKWRGHEFLAASVYDVPLPSASADVVISLYVIEHCVWPHRLLDEMFRLVRPGGLLAILTPPFRARSYLKSFNYGLSPRPFAQKLRSGALIDASWHLYHHRIYYPLFLRWHYPRGSARHRFLVHLDPVALTAGEWFPDADAVYLSDTAEMQDYIAALGADPLTHWPAWGYVMLRKAG